MPNFSLVLGIQIRVFILSWKALYGLNHLPSPKGTQSVTVLAEVPRDPEASVRMYFGVGKGFQNCSRIGGLQRECPFPVVQSVVHQPVSFQTGCCPPAVGFSAKVWIPGLSSAFAGVTGVSEVAESPGRHVVLGVGDFDTPV